MTPIQSNPIVFVCVWCHIGFWFVGGVTPNRDRGIKWMNLLLMFDKNKLFCFPIFSCAHRLLYLSVGDGIVNKNWTMSMVMMSKELWRQ
jgi:hypothetical protein